MSTCRPADLPTYRPADPSTCRPADPPTCLSADYIYRVSIKSLHRYGKLRSFLIVFRSFPVESTWANARIDLSKNLCWNYNPYNGVEPKFLSLTCHGQKKNILKALYALKNTVFRRKIIMLLHLVAKKIYSATSRSEKNIFTLKKIIAPPPFKLNGCWYLSGNECVLFIPSIFLIKNSTEGTIS